MGTIEKRQDFVLLVTSKLGNLNGDPNGNRPRTTDSDYGMVTDVCIKRKIRNRLQEEGYEIFVQAEDRPGFDGCKSLQTRAETLRKAENCRDDVALKDAVINKYIDARLFGAVLAYGKVSIGIRGPVTIQTGVTVDPVNIIDLDITKSVNGVDADVGKVKTSDTMGGHKYATEFGLYVIRGSVNAYLAERVGLTDEDVDALKEAIVSMFVSDDSAARPAGTIKLVKAVWWEHDCKKGQYSPDVVFDSVKIVKKAGVSDPTSIDDYDVTIDDSYQVAGNVLKHVDLI